MKNKLFLSLSILTSAFALQAEKNADFGAVCGATIAKFVRQELNSVVTEDTTGNSNVQNIEAVVTEDTTGNSNVQNIEAVVTENKISNSNVKNAEAIAAYQNLPAETRFERVRAITDEQLALAKIALANGLTSTKAALSNALVATQNGAVKGYNETKGYVIANPKKSAGIALGTAAVVAGTVLAYKKGYLKNPFAKAAKVTPVVTKAEDTKTTPVVKPVVKKAKKAKRNVNAVVKTEKKQSRTRRALEKVKAKFARKK